MDNNTKQGLLKQLPNKAKSAATAAAVTAMVAMPGLVLASGGGDFDGTEIIAKVVTYTAVGVAILAAFALGRWTLRALGLIGGK